MSAAVAPASGQASRIAEDERVLDLARRFQESTPCTLSGATDALKASAAGATPQDALVALGMLIQTENLCSPVRNAAEELRGSFAGQIAAVDPAALPVAPLQPLVEAPRPDVVAAAAIPVPDDRALVSQLQFEVGPPPANLTRGRVSTP